MPHCEFDIQKNVCLKKSNTFKVGGRAKYFFEPTSVEELVAFLQKKSAILPNVPCYFLGLGSNTLFPDGDLDLCVIRTRKLTGIKVDGRQVVVEAGLACAKLAKQMTLRGLNDAAWFAGIPGTMGGALRMNAGAFGGVTWDHVVEVTYANHKGDVFKLLPTDFEVAYRTVKAPFDGVFLSGLFEFSKAAPELDIKHYLQKRNSTQPIGTYNCGSVFKNPSNLFSAQLIEDVGLKGFEVGGAQVSKVHANFIENVTGHCSSQDVKQLIKMMQDRVFQKHGVMLEPEVVMVEV
jgi:UDP-N-acetylmuramate dehydrogenase